MKTILQLCSTLKATLQLLSGNYTASHQYSFQPLPAYWQMSPAGREGVTHCGKN